MIRTLYNRIRYWLAGRVVHLLPAGKPKGRVLLSYTTLPFLTDDERVLNGHTNRFECREMARAFFERSYAVDVIDFTNTTFVPRVPYDFCIDIGSNLERLTPYLNKDCIKIFHITGSHWEFQNKAEKARIEDIYKRRGIRLQARRTVPPNRGIELCDMATMLGNKQTGSTYAFAQKKMVRIPLSTTHLYPRPSKDLEAARKSYMWFGGAGAVHKGLDLALEAFAANPDYTLYVCGKFEGEEDFVEAYRKELYETPNIHAVGYIDPASEEFEKIRNSSIGIVYPSCSEGQAGSVVLAMHAGLIPIVSKETGVDVDGFGIVLAHNTTDEIVSAMQTLSSLPTEELGRRVKETWNYVQEHHTREVFAREYRKFLDTVV